MECQFANVRAGRKCKRRARFTRSVHGHECLACVFHAKASDWFDRREQKARPTKK